MNNSNAETTASSYCRLFLATPFCFDLPQLETLLGAAIAAGDVASVLLRHEDQARLRQAAMSLTKMLQDADIAVLINKDVKIALECGADGVQVNHGGTAYKAAREQLGHDRIVGVYCGTDRHSAMSAGEAGADYLAFSDEVASRESEPIGHWWARIFEVPCVVAGRFDLTDADDVSGAISAISAKVDFLCPESVWTSRQVAHETVAGLNRLIRDTKIEAV